MKPEVIDENRAEVRCQVFSNPSGGVMAQSRCRGCRDPLTDANDSEAHIIPNALGGWLAPTGIICRTCNTELDRIADNALVEAFGDWPTLLNLPRQRGKTPPKLMDTLNGHRVRMNADGTSTRTDVQYDVNVIPEGHYVQIAAGDMKTFRQLLRDGLRKSA
jgi:hypothetical protein